MKKEAKFTNKGNGPKMGPRPLVPSGTPWMPETPWILAASETLVTPKDF